MKLANVVSIKENPIEEYKLISEQIKNLEKIKEELKNRIFNLMDGQLSDEIEFNGFKAKRQLVIQERLDTKKVKDYLGESLIEFQTQTEVIRLTVL